jgi:type II secretory pathway pseudopilin PulG
MRNLIKISGGFILIELIASIVLIGIIGIFTSMFIYTGIKGYLMAKHTNEGAIKAQIALERINLELRNMSALSTTDPPINNSEITYTSDDLPGTRKIEYVNTDPDNPTINITGENGAYVLLDHVETFSLSLDVDDDLDASGDGNNEISGINIGFKITDVGKEFNLRIYPRNMLPEP